VAARRRRISSEIERALTRAVHLGRRQFLRLSAVAAGASAASAVLSGCGCDSSAGGTTTATVSTFRLSTHGERTCGACKAHGANRFYQTREAADGDRAHPGCNCRIVVHPISTELANEYFRNGDVFDKRRTT
jgi:hypothetical protein